MAESQLDWDKYQNYMKQNAPANPRNYQQELAQNPNMDNAQRAALAGEIGRHNLGVSQPQQQAVQAPQAQVSGGYAQGNQYGGVNSIYDAQQAMLLAQYKAAQSKALGQFNEQKSGLQPQYQSMRDQSDVANVQAVNRMREAMAANGLASGDRALGGSGDNITAQTALANQRQGNLNTLNLQQQQATNTIDNNIADLMNPMHEQAITSQIEFERAKAMMEDMRYQQDFGFRNDQFGWQKMMDEAGLTGQYGGKQTLAAQNQSFNQNFATNQFNQGQQNWEQEFQYRSAREQIKDEQYKQQFDEDVRRFGLQFGLDKARLNNQITQQNNDYNLAKDRYDLSKDQFDYGKDQDTLSRLYDQWKITGYAPSGIEGVAQGTPYSQSGSTAKPQTAEDYSKYIDGAAIWGTDVQNQKELKNPQQLEMMILQSGLSESEMRKLYIRYGISLN